MKTIKKILEFAFIVLFITIFLWAGAGSLFDHRIQHPFPWAYMASDAFQHQSRAEAIKTMGNYKYEAPYIVGGYTDVVGFYPPLLYFVGITFSNAAGLEIYDGLYLLVFLSAALGALLFYIIIRQHNKYVAVLSLPFMVLVFYKTSYQAFLWGNWPALFGQPFLIAFFWVVMRFQIERSWVILAAIFSAMILAHTSEAVFAVIYLALFSVMLVIKYRKSVFPYLKELFYAALTTFVVTIYYLIIFKKTFTVAFPFKFEVLLTYAKGTSIVAFTDFGPWLYLIIAGIVLGSIVLLQNLKKASELFFDHAGILVGLFVIVIGFGNYYGFSYRAFQLRLFWPIYLSVFIGIAIYFILRKTLKHFLTYYAAALLLLLLAGGIITVSGIPQVTAMPSAGLMNPYHWDSFQWMRKNLPQDANVLFYRGDLYRQDAMLRNIQRNHVLTGDNFNAITQDNESFRINRNIKIVKVGDCCGVGYPYRKSFFEYGYHYYEAGGDANRTATGDVCNYAYFVIDKLSGDQNLAKVNNAIREAFLKSNNIENVYDNGVVSILRNSKAGGNCA